MNRPDRRDSEPSEPRDRLSLLSEASFRITESLDFDTVLQEVVDSARAITSSRYGAITVVGESGQNPDLILSGMTREERRDLKDMPEGETFFEYFGGVSEPLRISDVDSHLRALDMPRFNPPISATSMLVVPILHQGVGIGTIYLAHGEDGREFAQEDEDTLVLFASQAAMAIAAARRHREARRAMADLETLIDISPVGMAVLDARTQTPVFLNREARKIVYSLANPGQTAGEIFGALTVRRSDGRESLLHEIPMAERITSGKTLRAEEIVVSVPDGRSVTLLINTAALTSDEGEAESLVIAMQDMAAVEELERLRAEFLATVSHELRTPLTSIRGSATAVLDASSELDPAELHQYHRIIVDQVDNMSGMIGDLLDVARIETGTLSISAEPTDVTVLVDRARNTFISAGGRNNLTIDIATDIPMVMADRRRVVQVLTNLLSNAARNSSESSVITVSAACEGILVEVSVSDEGQGISAESFPHLFRKFSRSQAEGQGGDTGLGLAICKGIVEAHGGRIWAESDGPGLGARFTFTLPTVDGAGSGASAGSTPVSTRPSRRKRGDAAERVRILVVDDDPETLRYVRGGLIRAGYDPIVTGEAEEALRLVEEEKPDLALLDLMLPGKDGIDLMKDILALADMPVIFLSAYGQDEIIARAFDAGASDYVVKPFSPTELAARIRAELRRREPSEPSEPYALGDLVIDYAQRIVTLGGSELSLVSLEYRMLVELSANAGRVLTYGHLLRRLWDGRSDGDLRPMRAIISRLRRKLGDDADNPTYIFTEPRVGYRMPRGKTPSEEPPPNA